jgi:hypothetical protein
VPRIGPARLWLVTAAVIPVLVAVGVGFALLPPDIQTVVVLLMIAGVAAGWMIPRASRADGAVSVGLLSGALVAKLAGTFIRYYVLEAIYGRGDAYGYHQVGLLFFRSVRALDFSFITPPYFGTPFTERSAAFLYGAIGPTLLGAFVVFALLAFIGAWCFYRAHRISFPQGDHRLYFLLLFFLPTMVFWPSSLGKDALIVFGLGVATYGIARLLHSFSFQAVGQFALGTAVTFGVRPPVAVMLMAGAAIGFLIHPGRLRDTLGHVASALLVAPVLAAGIWLAVGAAADAEEIEGLQGAAVAYETAQTSFSISGSSSGFTPADPTSPLGFVQAAATALFRPLPWEGGNLLAAAAGLEGMFILLLLLSRLPQAMRALRLWRGGMIVTALTLFVSLLVPLSAMSNFGLLVRQRAQMLPFLFMLLTAVRKPKRRAAVVRPPAKRVEPIPV